MLWRGMEQAPKNSFEYVWEMGEVGCAEVAGVVRSSMQFRWRLGAEVYRETESGFVSGRGVDSIEPSLSPPPR